MDLSVPYSGKWPNDVWVPDFESDDEEDVMLLGDFGEADDVDEADDDGGDEDGEEGDDGDDDDEDSPDEDEIERFCQSIEIVDEKLDDGVADEVDASRQGRLQKASRQGRRPKASRQGRLPKASRQGR